MLGNLFGGMNFGQMAHDDVKTLIERDWQKDDIQDAREDLWRRQNQTDALQREFAQMGIQWRVEDAKAAGLHPLFALGGGASGYSPTVGVATGGAPPTFMKGQNVARAAMAQLSPEQKEMQELQLEHQRLLNDKLFLDVYGGGASPRSVVGSPPGIPGAVNAELGPALTAQHPDVRRSALGVVELDPPKLPLANPNAAYESVAETTPGLRRFVYPNKDGKPRPIWLPTNKEDPAEALESISESLVLLYATIEVNKRLNSNFAYDFSYLIPGGDFLYGARDIATELLSQYKLQRDRRRNRPMPPAVRERAFPRDVDIIRR